MTRYWPTLLMFLALAGLGGYLYLVEFPAQQREEKQERAQKQVLPFPETAITGLRITTAQGPIELKLAEPGKWSIVAPLQTDADHREVQALIRALVTGTVTRTVEEQATQLAAFGLEQPVTILTVTGRDTTGDDFNRRQWSAVQYPLCASGIGPERVTDQPGAEGLHQQVVDGIPSKRALAVCPE